MANLYYERHLQDWLADDNNAHKLVENIEHLNEGELLEFLEYNKGAVDCLKHFWPDRDRKKIILACCYAILKTYEYEEAYRISIKKAEHEDYEQAGMDLYIELPAGAETVEIIGTYVVS